MLVSLSDGCPLLPEAMGYPSIATTCIACGVPFTTYCKFRMVSAAVFATRHNSCCDWIGLDDGRRVFRIGHRNIVDRKVPGRNVRVVGFRRGQQLVADDEGALSQSRQCWIDVLQTFDDQRSGGASLHLPFGEAVRVGMVPVKSRGLVLRNLHVVVEALAGLDQRVDHLILSADWRTFVPWKWILVAVADIVPLQALLLLVCMRRRASSSCRPYCRWRSRRKRRQVVLEMNDQLVTGIHSQRGCLKAGIRDVAIADKSLGIGYGQELEGDFQYAVLALQLRRRGGCGTGSKAGTDLICRVGSGGVR